jgi:hypothetical protein
MYGRHKRGISELRYQCGRYKRGIAELRCQYGRYKWGIGELRCQYRRYLAISTGATQPSVWVPLRCHLSVVIAGALAYFVIGFYSIIFILNLYRHINNKDRFYIDLDILNLDSIKIKDKRNIRLLTRIN